jgi:hypothetical protein
VALGYRTIRAAAAALVIAAAAGAGGMAGMASALAADPSMVTLGGTVVDDTGAPFAGVELVIQEELSDDGGLAAFHATTGDDGSFSAEVYPWGTADAPATITIRTAGDVIRVGDSCSQTWGVATTVRLPLAEAAAEPLAITATLVGEVCGTTGNPGGNTGNGGGRALTPPPTDVSVARLASAADRSGPALTVGFVVGLLLAILLLVPRPGARRRG